jgi:hypothetical protein
MKVNFSNIVKDDTPSKHRFLFRFVGEVVLDEHDIWSEEEPPRKINLKKVIAHLEQEHDAASELVERLIPVMNIDFTLDVSIPDTPPVVSLVDKADA